MKLNRSEQATYNQCLGQCHLCLLEGGCKLEDKLKAKNRPCPSKEEWEEMVQQGLVKMKYRIYRFGRGELLSIELSNFLPNKAKKERGLDVWTTPEHLGLWTKVCLNDTDIDFGTGKREPEVTKEE